jgi:DNA repair exonuclease SbcCD nuclease subunit
MVYGVVGNHDLALGERMDSLSGQPLGLLIAAGAYHNLSDEPVLFVNNIGSFGVQVESFPYDRAEGTLERILASRRHPKARYHIGIVHAYGGPGPGSTYFGEKSIGYDEIAGADFDYLLWGHDHSREETQKVGNVTHIRLGSLARAALDTDQTDRPVAVSVLSFSEDEEVKVKEIPVPVKPLEQAFVVADQAVRKVEKSEEMKEFFSKMDEAVEGVETSDPAEALRALCPDDPPLLALAKELCGL